MDDIGLLREYFDETIARTALEPLSWPEIELACVLAAPRPRRRLGGLPGTRLTQVAAAAVVVVLGAVVVQGHHGRNTPSSRATATAAANRAPAAQQAQQGVTTSTVRDGPELGSALAAGPAPAAASAVAGVGVGAGDALGPQIVRTGTVTLTAPAAQVPQVLAAVAAVATGLRGQVSDSTSSESGPAPSGSVTLRIPTARTDQAIRELRDLGAGSEVTAVTTASQDVTGQVVDLTARLKSLGESRDRYLELLAHTTSVGDTLAVQQRIDGVQTQIEQLQGQRDALANRTTLSTLVVTVSTRGAAASAAPARTGLSRSWHDARHHFASGVRHLVAGSGTVAFLLLCATGLGLVALAVRRVARRYGSRAG